MIDYDKSTTHELKTWPMFFEEVYEGRKKAELRKADRDFKIGDVLLLREWCPEKKKYTGRHQYGEITHIVNGGQFGLEEGYVMMSIR